MSLPEKFELFAKNNIIIKFVRNISLMKRKSFITTSLRSPVRLYTSMRVEATTPKMLHTIIQVFKIDSGNNNSFD